METLFLSKPRPLKRRSGGVYPRPAAAAAGLTVPLVFFAVCADLKPLLTLRLAAHP